MSKELTAKDILASDDIRKELVQVPEWGGHVYVRGLTGMERSQYQQMIIDAGSVDEEGNRSINLEGSDIFMATRTICDANGERLFTDDQVEELGQKSAQALGRCTDVASRLSAMTQADVDELVGNSEELPSDDSSSS